MSMFTRYSAQDGQPTPAAQGERVVWKYRLNPSGPMVLESIMLPVGARVLTTGRIDDKVLIWAMVDPNAPKAPLNYVVVGTGVKVLANDLDLDNMKYVGTLTVNDLVWHLFFEED